MDLPASAAVPLAPLVQRAGLGVGLRHHHRHPRHQGLPPSCLPPCLPASLPPSLPAALAPYPPPSLPASLQFALLGFPKWGPRPLAAGDPRLAYALPGPVDPRLHFALVCGAKSCPPIRVFDGRNLDRGLRVAAFVFLDGEVDVDAPGRAVTLSMILKWYGHDFGDGQTAVLRRVAELMNPDDPKKAQLEEMLRDGKKIAVKYRPYDWAVNE